MIALTDYQLATVMAAATGLSPEKRSLLLERVAAHLQLHGRRAGRRFGDTDVEIAVRAARGAARAGAISRLSNTAFVVREPARMKCGFHAAVANHIPLQRSVVKVDRKVATHWHSHS
jgi:hypothetical protein